LNIERIEFSLEMSLYVLKFMLKNMESSKKIVWTSPNYIVLKDTSSRLIKNLQVKAKTIHLDLFCAFFLSNVYMWAEPIRTMCVRIFAFSIEDLAYCCGESPNLYLKRNFISVKSD
jgi:hypothetical protein